MERKSILSYDLVFKVSLLAMEGVGIHTLISSNFIQDFDIHTSVYGLNFATKNIEINGKKIRLSVWIYSSEIRFKFVQSYYLNGSNVVLVIYDITNAKTLNFIHEWLQNIKESLSNDIPILLVGNKLDLEENREISSEQIELFKENNKISSSMEISIQTGKNVEEMFMNIGRMILNSPNFGINMNERKGKNKKYLKNKKRRSVLDELKSLFNKKSPNIRDSYGSPYKITTIKKDDEPSSFKEIIENVGKPIRSEEINLCKHCGSIISKDQKICTVCGKMVL